MSRFRAKHGNGWIVAVPLFLFSMVITNAVVSANVNIVKKDDSIVELKVRLAEVESTLIRLDLLSFMVNEIIHCESSGTHDVYGEAGEYGIAQFMESTFYELAKKSGMENPDWKSEEQQRKLLTWSLVNGYSSKWTCYDIVMEKI